MTDFDPWSDPEEPPPDNDLPPDHEDQLLAEMEAAAARARRIAHEADRLRIQDLARRQVAKERQAERPPPRLLNLTEFLAEHDDDPTYRIDQLWPTGGRILVPAQFKAGKTTLVGNLIRALADGTPFLDTFGVRPAGHIVLIDDELDTRVLRRWLRDHQIQNQAAVSLVPLRGNVGSFDLLDPDVLAEWAKLLNGADIIILDCLRPVLDSLGLDENHDAGRFLVQFDTLLSDAGCTESAVIHHMGHNGERSRGDSRLNDWPDAIWKLVRDKDEENPDLDDVTGARYFSAYGRDVDHPQAELTYNPDTRHLSLQEHAPNRKIATNKRKERAADEAVMQAIETKPGLNSRALRQAVRDIGVTNHDAIDQAVERLIENGRIWRQKQGAARLHWPAAGLSNPSESDSVPSVPNLFETGLGTPEPTCPPSVPFRAGSRAHSDPPSNLGHTDDPNRAQDKNLGTPETKDCPDCSKQIPAILTRCANCTTDLIRKTREATITDDPDDLMGAGS